MKRQNSIAGTTDPRPLVDRAVSSIRSTTTFRPQIAIILGSGLGGLADRVTPEAILPYGEIPGFVPAGVHGHKGQLILGSLERRRVLVMQGRYHRYEGHSLEQVTFPVRVFRALGVDRLIVSNAAGGLNRNFRVGDLMIITDVINLMFDNPLRGPNDSSCGPRFPDMSRPFSPRLMALAEEVARRKGIALSWGTYAAVTGPCYETPAELRFMSRIGIDAVGMSTVPETIVARQVGVSEVLGISFITNVATGEVGPKVSHDEVLKAAAEGGPRFVDLVQGVVRQM